MIPDALQDYLEGGGGAIRAPSPLFMTGIPKGHVRCRFCKGHGALYEKPEGAERVARTHCRSCSGRGYRVNPGLRTRARRKPKPGVSRVVPNPQRMVELRKEVTEGTYWERYSDGRIARVRQRGIRNLAQMVETEMHFPSGEKRRWMRLEDLITYYRRIPADQGLREYIPIVEES